MGRSPPVGGSGGPSSVSPGSSSLCSSSGSSSRSAGRGTLGSRACPASRSSTSGPSSSAGLGRRWPGSRPPQKETGEPQPVQPAEKGGGRSEARLAVPPHRGRDIRPDSAWRPSHVRVHRPPPAHRDGALVVALAVVASVMALRSKGPDRQLREISVALIAALVAQAALGFATLALGSAVVGWIHLLVGVITYAIALTGMSFAQRQE